MFGTLSLRVEYLRLMLQWENRPIAPHTKRENIQAVIGINNRNLHDFSVDISTSLRLAGLCPPEIVKVAESGIYSFDDINKLAEAKIDAVLVGEALVTAPDVAAMVRNLSGVSNG